ncbi:MAG TPA: hypothetical protein VD707_00515 [Gemmatimonadales bacterium]|nr:hypothetical protein [Gemmatimonadales bacterium]
MTRARWLLALAAACAGPLAAQGGTADQLARARALYEELQIERALPLLREVVSPQWPFEVTVAQRVEAYTYLGAALALARRTDSAVVYFRAALERDPFVQLDPERFTPAQLQAFARARRETFAVGTRPIRSGRVDPRTDRVRFIFVTTHAAAVRAELRAAGAGTRLVLFEADADGVRELAWDGLGPDGRLAPPGRYELHVDAASRLRNVQDSAHLYFDLRHDVRPLEDTLPGLGAADLLPERASASAAAGEIAAGLGVAGGALAISGLLANSALDGAGTGAAVVAGVATVTGLVAYIARRRHPEIPENVAANDRRRDERRAANDSIRARNAARLAQTALVLTPAAGVGP